MPQRVRDTTLANPRLLLDLGNLAYPRQNRATLSTFSTSPMTDLPIHAVLPDLLSALNAASNAVLVAPPGAGKTTAVAPALLDQARSEEHTSELQSLMRNSYAVFCLKKTN